MTSRLTVTAMVTAFRRPEPAIATIDRLEACVPPPAEILVHVDADQHECATRIRTAHPNVRVIVSQRQVGPGGGRNVLVTAARHPIVASFDDDSYPVDADYFARLVHLFDAFPADMVAAEVYQPGSLDRTVEAHARWVADFVGCGCAYRRATFLRLGGYVPVPVAYGMEEADFALRLHAVGGRVLYAPELRVLHDSDLTHRDSATMMAATVANLGLLAYLRYPIFMWPLGVAQCVKRIVWLARHRSGRGIATGVAAIPGLVAAYRSYRMVVSAKAVRSYLRLRHHPLPAAQGDVAGRWQPTLNRAAS
jgi:GT2 family glycosyltransferase